MTGTGKWMTIETPHFDKLLDYQKLDKEEKKKICVLLGRLLQLNAKKDDWNTLLYLNGVPGSGKTMVLDLMTSIVGCDKTIVLSKTEKNLVKAKDIKEGRIIVVDEVTDADDFPEITIEDKVNSDSDGSLYGSIIMAGNGELSKKSAEIINTKCNLFVLPFKNTWESDISFKEELHKEIANIKTKLESAYEEAISEGLQLDYFKA